MKRLLVLTGGGDCPGLNAVIRAIVKRAAQEKDWEVLGSIQAYNGILWEPTEVVRLTPESVRGIHFRGGTIIETTNKGGPFNWPVKNADGTWTTVDRSDEMLRKLQYMGIDAVISIGGDGSQRIWRAQDHRQRPLLDRMHLRLSDRRADCHRGCRQARHHSGLA